MNWTKLISAGLVGVALAVPFGSAYAGTIYWSLFNRESESVQNAVYVTYATLDDMLNDENRVSSNTPDGLGAGINVVGSGAYFTPDPDPDPVPEPGTLALFGLGLAGLGLARRRKVAA